MRRAGLAAALLILAALARQHAYGGPPVQIEDAKLIASDGQRGDIFGASVAIGCDVAVVGAPFDDDRGLDYGSAYVFRRQGTIWFQEQKLLAPEPFAGDDGFGDGVAISADTIMVSAVAADTVVPAGGAVFVYGWDGQEWVLRQELVPSDPEPFAYFGRSPAIDGNVAVFGTLPFSGQGAVYVFRQHQDMWIQEQKLLSPGLGEQDNFGLSVSVSGNVIVAGARFSQDNGAAHIFRWNGSAWLHEQTVFASDGAPGDQFGYSVAVDEDVTMVGAPSKGGPTVQQGGVYVYTYSPGIPSPWAEVQEIGSPSGDPDRFGLGISLNRDVAAIGDLGGGFGLGAGTGYLYEKAGDVWVMTRTLTSSDLEDFDNLARAVAIMGGYAILGATGNDDACPDDPHCNSGSAYVYALTGDDCNANSIPDSCEVDCDSNVIPDDCDIRDCPGNAACADCNGNGIPDGCELDCNANGIADECDITACAGDRSCADENQNGIPDGCEFGACCDRDPFGGCTDVLIRERCDCPSCDWTEMASCADIECAHESIPTLGTWGLTILALLILIAGKCLPKFDEPELN